MLVKRPGRPVGPSLLALATAALAASGAAAALPSPRALSPLALPPIVRPDAARTPLPWRPPMPPTLVEHGPRDARRLALTFDACSTSAPSGYEGRITDVLIRTQTPATLFLGGKWMLREERHVRELAALPFLELGLHGFSHPHMSRVSVQRIVDELTFDEAVLYNLTGRRADVFRPPFGDYNEKLLRVAASLGFLTINFDAASGDADPRATRDKLVAWVPHIVRPGSIVVMHINGRGWHTAEALEALITTLRKQGFELVTVSELLGRRDRAAGLPRAGEVAPELAAQLEPALPVLPAFPTFVARLAIPPVPPEQQAIGEAARLPDEPWTEEDDEGDEGSADEQACIGEGWRECQLTVPDEPLTPAVCDADPLCEPSDAGRRFQ
jgi:peptidoglycan/xylan/chitin deacetylase (PgdA/CDA1 family)